MNIIKQKAVGYASYMPATTGFTMACFNSKDVPAGEPLYIGSAAAAAPDLMSALEGMIELYTSLVNSGDAGNWDCEKEDEVIAARAALSLAKST